MTLDDPDAQISPSPIQLSPQAGRHWCQGSYASVDLREGGRQLVSGNHYCARHRERRLGPRPSRVLCLLTTLGLAASCGTASGWLNSGASSLRNEGVLKTLGRRGIVHRGAEGRLIQSCRPELDRRVPRGVRVEDQPRHSARCVDELELLEDLLGGIREQLHGGHPLLSVDRLPCWRRPPASRPSR